MASPPGAIRWATSLSLGADNGSTENLEATRTLSGTSPLAIVFELHLPLLFVIGL